MSSFDDKKIKQLIDYIINEPGPDANEKEGHKYPFVSHEILKSQSQIIVDHFFPSLDPKRKASTNSKGTPASPDSNDPEKNNGGNSPLSSSSKRSQVLIIDENSYHKENLDYLFSLLGKRDEINCVLAGYFGKVVGSFFQKNKKEVCSYFYSNDSHANNFVHHLYSKSLVDPLKHFLIIHPEDPFGHMEEAASEKTKSNPFGKFYSSRVRIFQLLYNLLDRCEDQDTIANVQFILETLVAKLHETVDGNRLIDDVVLRKENLKILFACLKSVDTPHAEPQAETQSSFGDPEPHLQSSAQRARRRPGEEKHHHGCRRLDHRPRVFQTLRTAEEGREERALPDLR